MRGVILGIHEGRGVLTASDQRRLEFPVSEWRSPGAPMSGQSVDFVEENGEARAVYVVPSSTFEPISAPGSRSTVLGAVGVVCLALGFVIPLVPTVVALVLGLMGASQARDDRDQTGLALSRVSWIGASVVLIASLFLVAAFGAVMWHMFSLWDVFHGWRMHMTI